MEVLSYSQAVGFALVPEFIEWEVGEEPIAFADRAGFFMYDADAAYVGGESENVLTYYYKKDGPWRYMAILDSISISRVILTENQAEEIALRLKLMAFVATPSDSLNRINTVLDRLFRAYHGHDPLTACNECDPAQAREDREFSNRLQQR